MPFPRAPDDQPKQCRRCGETKPSGLFGAEPRNRDGIKSYCRPCDSKVANAWRKKDPARHSEYNRQWAKRNHRSVRNTWMKRLYGVTADLYDALFDAQSGKCAICGGSEPGGKGRFFHVDHCHDTETIRGLLCNSCNLAIGHLKHSREILQAAIDYLKISRTPR